MKLSQRTNTKRTSFNDRNSILSNEDSYTYQKCVDTGSTDTSLKREF